MLLFILLIFLFSSFISSFISVILFLDFFSFKSIISLFSFFSTFSLFKSFSSITPSFILLLNSEELNKSSFFWPSIKSSLNGDLSLFESDLFLLLSIFISFNFISVESLLVEEFSNGFGLFIFSFKLFDISIFFIHPVYLLLSFDISIFLY